MLRGIVVQAEEEGQFSPKPKKIWTKSEFLVTAKELFGRNQNFSGSDRKYFGQNAIISGTDKKLFKQNQNFSGHRQEIIRAK